MNDKKNNTSVTQRGAISGIIAGLFFAVLLGVMGAFPMIASAVRSDSAFVGFMLHIIISAVIGIIYALIFDSYIENSVGRGTVYGIVYGIIWWFLGPLIIFPLLLGMAPTFSVSAMFAAFSSLLGHLIYGLVLGITYPILSLREHERKLHKLA